MKLFRFADVQESCFTTAIRSNIRNAVLQGGQIATAQESRFQAWNRSYIRSTRW